VILDAVLPDANLLETLALIRRGWPRVPVLVLTAAVELEFVIQSMKAGANGLIHKHRASQDLLEAVRRVADGGSWLHPETAAQVAATLREAPHALAHQALSGRELEIFKLIALGLAIKEIAGKLALSDKTVATYLTRIREKTGLQSHVEIARYALKHQLVD
jgi:DNA-binding NarL/FixJ family response regulator